MSNCKVKSVEVSKSNSITAAIFVIIIYLTQLELIGYNTLDFTGIEIFTA